MLWLAGAVYVLLSVLAAQRLFATREYDVERERNRVEAQLHAKVEAWEDELLGKLQAYLEEATAEQTADRMGALQRRYRKQQRWFDSLFVWLPTQASEPARFVFPLPSAPLARSETERSPCLRLLPAAQDARTPLDERLKTFLAACRTESATVRLQATTQAAYQLLGKERYQDAWNVLEQARVTDTMRTAVERGVDPFRLAAWRTLRMKVLLQLGLGDAAAALALNAGAQMAELDAPDLPAVLPHLRTAIDLLEKQNRRADAAKLGEAMARAERRSHAYQEINIRLKAATPPSGDPEPGRLVYDLYSDQPFLLYYGWANGLGGGLSLEQNLLVQDFLRDLSPEMRSAVSIAESRTERWVAGTRTGGKCAAIVPFDRSLTNLQVCAREQWLRSYRTSLNDQMFATLGVIFVANLLGIGALFALDRASQHEFELIQRQRAFTTRVTHELKTPLAGIRVMAENIEFGAFRDDAHRREMAGRIVAESDQLTKRVDEVLSAAKERTIPRPQPVDPEEVALMAVEDWGPRLRDAGVTLHAERILSTDPVLGDDKALRDAVSCLLDNALKYRREDRADPAVWLELEQSGKYVLISVKDNGLGVPRAVRKRVFDRFFRVEGPHRGRAGGHGLGLHEVRQIVDAHHGTVTCTDGVDGGAQFTIRLPALRSPER
jgi:signal transduction histidine kinase